MTTAETAFVIASLAVVMLAVEIALAYRRYWRYARIAHTERTRSAWAEARDMLMTLVVEEKIDPRSATFCSLYPMMTFVVRRPDDYEEIASKLRQLMLGPQTTGKPGWMKEVAAWPKEMWPVTGRVVSGITLLMVGVPGWGRVFRVGRWLAPVLGRLSLELPGALVRQILGTTRHARIEGDLLRARDHIEELEPSSGQQPRQLAPMGA